MRHGCNALDLCWFSHNARSAFLKRTWFLLCFLWVVPTFAADEAPKPPFPVSLPKGWIDVTARIAKDQTQGIPEDLLQIASHGTHLKNAYEFIAADGRSFQGVGPAYLYEVASPLEGDGWDQDPSKSAEALRSVQEGFEESAQRNRDKGMMVFENTITRVKGRPVIRIVMKTWKTTKFKTKSYYLQSLCYIFFYSGKNISLVFFAPEDQWAKYLPLFEKLAAKTIP